MLFVSLWFFSVKCSILFQLPAAAGVEGSPTTAGREGLAMCLAVSHPASLAGSLRNLFRTMLSISPTIKCGFRSYIAGRRQQCLIAAPWRHEGGKTHKGHRFFSFYSIEKTYGRLDLFFNLYIC